MDAFNTFSRERYSSKSFLVMKGVEQLIETINAKEDIIAGKVIISE
ncbi:hypothetical protein [Anaerocolumna aminovalerica]|nr:hypothetical protein [Anaerocolumna aminovalerica]